MRLSGIILAIALTISLAYTETNKERNKHNWVEYYTSEDCSGVARRVKPNGNDFDIPLGARSFKLNIRPKQRRGEYYAGHPYPYGEHNKPPLRDFPKGHPICSNELYKSHKSYHDFPKPEAVHAIDPTKDEEGDRQCFVTHNARWGRYLRCLNLV